MRKLFLLPLLLLPMLGYSLKVPFYHYYKKHPDYPNVEAPWFTGPLLCPSSFTVPPGHWNFEPYVFAVANTGDYDQDWNTVEKNTFWNTFFQPEFQIGLTSWLDFEINPTVFYNYTHGAGCWSFADMSIVFDFQLYKRGVHITDWTMGLKFVLREVIPFGKFQNLDPKKLGTDLGGGGSWQTSLGLVWGNLFYLWGEHFLTWRTSLQYTLPAPVHVKNLNAYGGGPGTNGVAYPAQNFQIDTAFEFSLTRSWVLACDFVGSWSGKARFKGETLFPMTALPGTQFSIAPAIEYNWNANLGMIIGPWFTVAGRNAVQFASGVAALNYYY